MIELSHVLAQSKDVNTAEMCVRGIIVFVYGLVAVRVSGRRTFGHWSALDIVVSIVVGSALGRAVTGGSAMVATLASTSVILVMHWIFAAIVVRWPAAARLIEGHPVILAQGGRIDEAACFRMAISHTDLEEAMRQHGLEDIAETRLVAIEPSGKISVLKP